jgi:hypothetical protein
MAAPEHLNTSNTGGKAVYRDEAGSNQDPAKATDFALRAI